MNWHNIMTGLLSSWVGRGRPLSELGWLVQSGPAAAEAGAAAAAEPAQERRLIRRRVFAPSLISPTQSLFTEICPAVLERGENDIVHFFLLLLPIFLL